MAEAPVAERFRFAFDRLSLLAGHELVRSGGDARGVAEVLGELQRTIEELEVAEEELRDQADALAALHEEREQQRRRAAALFELAPQSYLVTDSAGTILAANEVALGELAESGMPLVGEPLATLIPLVERQAFRERLLQVGSSAGRHQLNLTIVGGRGHVRRFVALVVRTPSAVGSPELLWMLHDAPAVEQRAAFDGPFSALPVGSVGEGVQRQRLEAQVHHLQRISDSALAHLSLDQLLPDLLQRVRHELGADAVSVLLLAGDGGHLVVRAVAGASDPVDVGQVVPVGQGVAGRIAATRTAMVVPDLAQVELVNPMLQRRGVRSLVGAPLLVEERLLGIIHADARQAGQFTADDLELLQLAAARVALAVDHARRYDEALAALRLRDEATVAITHDLGQPLAAVKGYAQLLLQRLGSAGISPPDWLPDGLRGIDDAAGAMLALVDELRDMAQLQRGRPLELRRVDLNLTDLVRQQVALYRRLNPMHRLRLEAREDVHGYWDGARLQRVISNLLSNAVKYSPEGGRIRVTVRREARGSENRVAVSVRDQGIGIPAGDLASVFERFHRASNVRERFEGTGIGLAGAKQIVEQHGGRISIESQEHRGTRVTFHLPLGADAPV